MGVILTELCILWNIPAHHKRALEMQHPNSHIGGDADTVLRLGNAETTGWPCRANSCCLATSDRRLLVRWDIPSEHGSSEEVLPWIPSSSLPAPLSFNGCTPIGMQCNAFFMLPTRYISTVHCSLWIGTLLWRSEVGCRLWCLQKTPMGWKWLRQTDW